MCNYGSLVLIITDIIADGADTWSLGMDAKVKEKAVSVGS